MSFMVAETSGYVTPLTRSLWNQPKVMRSSTFGKMAEWATSRIIVLNDTVEHQ